MRSLRGSGGHCDISERGGCPGFLPLVGKAAKMATRRHSTEVADGAPMERWFWTGLGEIGARVGAVDNRGALITPFIGP
jgi:hypothetical protein